MPDLRGLRRRSAGRLAAVVGLVGMAGSDAVAGGSPATESWERSGSGWAEGRHRGTRERGGSLTLAEGALEGSYSARSPHEGPFDRLLVSLNHAPFAAGAELRVRVRVQVAGAWTAWLPLGVYGAGPNLPRSEAAPPERGVEVAVDIVQLTGAPGEAAEVRLELRGAPGGAPVVRRLHAAAWLRAAQPRAPRSSTGSPAWGRVLEVPERSQQVEDPALAGRVCSPTSLSMVLAYWGRAQPTATVAAGVYDWGADIYGNWGFNVAYAGTQGVDATATHLDGFGPVEDEVAAGRPVVLSHKFAAGELGGAPMTATAGHLITVVGFTPEGDVVVHDPAADPRDGEAIRRVYRRDELYRSWQLSGEGVAYLLRPRE